MSYIQYDQQPDILLVEDNPGDVRLIQEAFEAANFTATVHTARDGDEALEFLDGRARSSSEPYPDLVLLDLNLPKLDGFDVLEALRDDPQSPPIPVLILTSSTAEEDVARGYELSANAYLTKPDDHDEFVALARSIKSFWFEEVVLPSA